MYTNASTTTQPPNFFESKWFRQNAPDFILLGFLVLVAVIAKNYQGKKKKLAKGGVGDQAILDRARRQGIKEVGTTLNKSALWLGDPESKDAIWLRRVLPGILIEGGPDSGKSFTFFNQFMLSVVFQRWGCVMVDFKYPKQTARIADYAKRCGYEVGVLAPTFPETGTLNPVDLLRSPIDTIRAEEIIKVAKLNMVQSKVQSEGDKFWDDASTQTLAAGLCLIKTWKYADILTLRAMLSLDDLPQRLKDNRDSIPPSIYAMFGQIIAAQRNARQFTALLSTCLQLLDKMTALEFLPSIIGKTTVPLDVGPNQMLIIGLNRAYKEVLSPSIGMFAHAVIEHNLTQPRETPLAFFCDELPALTLPKIKNWLSEGREDGFCGILGFQSVHQLIERYGKEGAEIIYTGSPTKAFMNPNNINVAHQMAKWTGDIEVDYTLKSRGRNKGGSSSNVSDQVKVKLALEATEINRMPQGTALIVSPGFETKTEAFIPVKRRIRVPEKNQKIIQLSEQRWKTHMRPELIGASQSKPYTQEDIRLRTKYAAEMLPLTKTEESEDDEL